MRGPGKKFKCSRSSVLQATCVSPQVGLRPAKGEMQIRWKLLAALTLMAMPLSAQMSEPKYLSDLDHKCTSTLADGTAYEVWDRVLATEWDGKPSYLPVRALYRPGSGEFLWRCSLGFSDKEHASEMMEKPQKGRACLEDPQHHILLLQDGEWIDFWALNGGVGVVHSNLKIDTPKKHGRRSTAFARRIPISSAGRIQAQVAGRAISVRPALSTGRWS
jgi:hypothetical protein